MNDVKWGKTAVLGIAYAAADGSDARSLWRQWVNGGRYPAGGLKRLPQRRLDSLFVETISRALADAGMGATAESNRDMRCLVFGADAADEIVRDRISAHLKIERKFIEVRDARDINELAAVCKARAGTVGRYDGVTVVAAIKSSPEVKCMAMVFGSHPMDRETISAYATIQSMEGPVDLKREPEAISEALKKAGHLVCLARGGGGGCLLPDAGRLPGEKDVPLPACIEVPPNEDPGVFAGLETLARAAMSISNKIITPSPRPGEKSVWPGSAFYPNCELRPWIHCLDAGPRTAAVMFPGKGDGLWMGIMEEVRDDGDDGDDGDRFCPRAISTGVLSESELVVLAADTAGEMISMVRCLTAFIDATDCPVDKLAATLAMQYDAKKKHRLAIVCASRGELVRLLEMCIDRLASGKADFDKKSSIFYTPNAGMTPGLMGCLFPGLGFPGLLGQYADHLKSLALHFPEFRNVFDDVELRDGHPEDPVPTSHLFFPPQVLPEAHRMRLRKRLASPRIEDACRKTPPFARNLSSFGVSVANWASWKLLQALNIIPDVLFGQSLGELSALCASGALRFDDFISCCWDVSLDSADCLEKARLALVSADIDRLAPLLGRFNDVHIAIHVGPEFQILGGETRQLTQVIEALRQEGVWTHFLPYSAIHTPNLSRLRPLMEPFLKDIPVHGFDIPVYSGMSGDVYPQDIPAVRQLMTANIDHPVLLWQTTRKMYEDGVRMLVQVGGGATMHAQAKSNVLDDGLIALSLDVDYRSAMDQLNHVCAALLTNGVDVNIRRLYEHRGSRVVSELKTELRFQGDARTGAEENKKEPALPFIGTVLEYTKGKLLLAERRIDMDRDLFIRDHLFIYTGGVAPDAHCLPVVPMTVSLEMMAEAAACLTPGCGLTGFEDVRASRWIALLDAKTLSLQIRAEYDRMDSASGIHRVKTAIYTPDSSNPAIQGTILLGSNYVAELHPVFTAIDAPYRYPFAEDAVYGERHMFHGPIFHCVTGKTAMTGNKVVGTLRVKDRRGIFSFSKNPALMCEPFLLDGVGQLAGLWAMDRGKHVFPIGVGKIEIYSPVPEPGSYLPILLEVKEFGSKILSADVEIQDGKGRVWMRIQNWQDWVFNWPRGIYDFRRHPERSLPSRNLTMDGLPPGSVVQYVSKKDLRDVWLDVAARFFLHPDEMKHLSEIQTAEGQWQWLMGRIAAKDALRRLMAEPDGRMHHPAGMRLEEKENGTVVMTAPAFDACKPTARIRDFVTGALAIAPAYDGAVCLDQLIERAETPAAGNEKEPDWRLLN